MARSRKTRAGNGKAADKNKLNAAGGRPLWKGSISFGLVSIPVALYGAESSKSLDFDLLDARDRAPIQYKRFNKRTGREVAWNQIVKGYQYKKGEYVTLSEGEFRKANPEATQSIDISDFVDAAEISPIFFAKPYYLVPLKNGRRAYVLLRRVLEKSGKVAIARVVIRTRQHLAAVIPQQQVLVLNVLRFAQEIRDSSKLGIPRGDELRGISAGEVRMAERLIETMTGAWNPAKYRDQYRDDLIKTIDKKVKSGRAKVVSETKTPVPKASGKVLDIMHLLQRSVERAQKKEEPARRRKAG